MIRIISLLIVCCPFLGFSQGFRSGLILPIADSLRYSDKYCCILSPEKGFQTYDRPNGQVTGILKRVGDARKDDQVPYKIYFVSGSTNKMIDEKCYREIASELSAFTYTDIVDGYLKIGDPSGYYWLKLAEIRQQGFKAVSWMDFLVTHSGSVLGYYANEPGLRVRKEPDANSEVIGSVRGELFEIKLTGETSGQWAKVRIKKYKDHPCNTSPDEKDNLEYISEGWLKVLNDTGVPNIWHYTRGC